MDPLPYSADEIRERYGYKSVVIENYQELYPMFLKSSSSFDTYISRLYSIWYKTFKCFEELEKYKTQEYDLVIRTRPDVIMYAENPRVVCHTHPAFDILNLPLNKLTIPWYNNHNEPHDYFAAGPYNIMKKYCDMYNQLPDVMSKTNRDEPNFHAILYEYLLTTGVELYPVTNFLSIQR
jgi:hypothetical protein